MKSRYRVYITFGVLIVLITGLYFFSDWFSKTTGYVLGEDQQVVLVRCLSEKFGVLYVKDDCVECLHQKEIFVPRAFALLRVVSCDLIDCSNLESVPAWEINGKFHYGKMDFKQLSSASGCEIGE